MIIRTSVPAVFCIALLTSAAAGPVHLTADPSPDLDSLEAESVKSSLAWLARRQEADGHWKASGQANHGFEALYEPDAAKSCDVMATSLALLAFVGDNSTPWHGPYRESVRRGMAWLAAVQRSDGCLLADEADAPEGSLSERERAARKAHVSRLNQLWGTLALIELYVSADRADPTESVTPAVKADERAAVRKQAVDAARFIASDPSTRARRFDFLNERTVNMDELSLLAAIWYSGGPLGTAVEGEFWDTARASLKKVQVGQTEAFVPYRYSEEGEYWFRGTVSTPQMLISWVYMSIPGGLKQLETAGPLLLAHPPVWNPHYELGRPSLHPDGSTGGAPGAVPPDGLPASASAWKDDITNEASWFWQAMAFRSVGGEAWNRWRASFVPMAWEQQRRSGAEAGSWDPAGPHARVFGREVSTAWMAIALQSGCRLLMARTSWSVRAKDARADSAARILSAVPKTREQCAVCGLEVMSDTEFGVGRGPDRYYFCSEEHKEKFETNPEPYLQESAGQSRGREGADEGAYQGR